jgi:hypothetical protein
MLRPDSLAAIDPHPVLQVPLLDLDGAAHTLASLLEGPDAPRGGLVVGFLRHYG